MPSTHRRGTIPYALALLILALVGVAFVVATNAASAADPSSDSQAVRHRAVERLVVRGEDTVKDAPCDGPACTLELTGGAFRGTLGSGSYTGAVTLAFADAFSNGEHGLCAPIRGHVVLGAGTPDRLVLAFRGDSCQDGEGPPTAASFTGVARFVVVHGTGAYAGASGGGLLTSSEDANDREHLTLIGRIAR